MGGGGGGGNGAADREEKRRLEEEARAKAAVERINSLFGIGGDANAYYAPNVADYQRKVWTNGSQQANSAAPMLMNKALASNGVQLGTSAPGSFVQDGVVYYDQPRHLDPYTVTTKTKHGHDDFNYDTKTVTPAQMYQTTVTDKAYDTAMQAYQRGAALRSRNQLYDTVGNDTFNYHAQRLDDSRDQAERGLRFQLARQGQFGGSLDVDQNSELAKGYNNGLMDARNLSDAARNDAMASDDQTRIDLINRVNAGMDEGSALASASSQMQSNINQARDQALSQSLGDAFGNVALLKKQWDYQQGMNQVQSQFPNYFKQTANNGTVRS